MSNSKKENNGNNGGNGKKYTDPFRGIEDEDAEMQELEKSRIEAELNSEYIDLKRGTTKVIRILLARGVNVVEKTYQGKPSGKKHQYIGVDLTADQSNRKEQFFEIGWNSRKILEPLLHDGHRLFSCTKVGEGQDTKIIPTALD